MFEEFSAGYYLGQLYIEPHDVEPAVMDHDQFEAANEHIYATGDGLDRLDTPLVVKLDTHHFPVVGTDEVPPDTLAVPEPILETTRIENPPILAEILIAKADRATQLLEWCTPYTVRDPDVT